MFVSVPNVTWDSLASSMLNVPDDREFALLVAVSVNQAPEPITPNARTAMAANGMKIARIFLNMLFSPDALVKSSYLYNWRNSGIIAIAQRKGDHANLCLQPWQLALAGAFLPARQTCFAFHLPVPGGSISTRFPALC
jgi:hypothetical protein